MGKKMEITKARALVKEYSSNGYKQGEALEKLGYAKTTQRAMSGIVLNKALHRIIEEDRILLMESNNPKATLLQMVGVTPEQVIGEYMSIIQQNKDLTNKLKALTPLLKPLGIAWDEKATVNAPTLNLTVKEVSVPIESVPVERLNKAVELESHNIHSGTWSGSQDTAQQSHAIENGSTEPYNDEGGSDSVLEEEKEGGCPITNFDEKGTLDNAPIELHNREVEAPPEIAEDDAFETLNSNE